MEVKQNKDILIGDFWKKTEEKFSAQVDRVADSIPYVPSNGKYSDMGESDIFWWTNGFWPGILWQMFHATGAEKYKEAAVKVEKRLDRALEGFDGLHHDVGFMWLLSSVANFRLTGNERSKTRGMHAATILAGRYNPRGKYIRAWNEDRPGWIIVDSMMNIPLLYWASEMSGDPRFHYIAVDHANTVLSKVVRPDGSCNHIAILDPTNGELLETPAGQGYADGSSWSRGQAWALYGFALSYRYTKDESYLNAAKKIAHYFVSNVANDGYISLLDFRAPKEPRLIDTTAAVCAACGLLEIAGHTGQFEDPFYSGAALNILEAVGNKYCNWDPAEDSLVSHGSESYHGDGIHIPIIYGDYFFVEGILRVLNKSCHLW